MLNVTVEEIQRDPSKYLRQVEAGETFVILQADKVIAELRPISLSGRNKLYSCGRSKTSICARIGSNSN
jgi:antitoxin (DNA-binding transcriptional repressor) of toxin-antitoxin stability system